ncbi:hypothetical protein ACQ4PT_002594 [Festuca glaucescens]
MRGTVGDALRNRLAQDHCLSGPTCRSLRTWTWSNRTARGTPYTTIYWPLRSQNKKNTGHSSPPSTSKFPHPKPSLSPLTMPPPPEAPAEIIEEIFLRLPLDEPEWLVRASLASKHWLSLLTGPAFHTRYREFHGAPPMLGFLYTSIPGSSIMEHFVSTTKFGTRARDMKDWGVCCLDYDAWDCRHGRVLLCDTQRTSCLGPHDRGLELVGRPRRLP